MAPHDGLGEHGAIAGGQTGGRVGRTEQVGGGEERLALVVETGDEQVVPERVELGAASIEELGEVAVQIRGGKAGLVGEGVGLVEREVCQVPIDVLHIGDIAAEADDGGTSEGGEALDVGEAGEGAVRS